MFQTLQMYIIIVFNNSDKLYILRFFGGWGGGLVDSVFEKCRQCLTKHSQIRDIFFFKKQQQTTTDFISYSPSITYLKNDHAYYVLYIKW